MRLRGVGGVRAVRAGMGGVRVFSGGVSDRSGGRRWERWGLEKERGVMGFGDWGMGDNEFFWGR